MLWFRVTSVCRCFITMFHIFSGVKCENKSSWSLGCYPVWERKRAKQWWFFTYYLVENSKDKLGLWLVKVLLYNLFYIWWWQIIWAKKSEKLSLKNSRVLFTSLVPCSSFQVCRFYLLVYGFTWGSPLSFLLVPRLIPYMGENRAKQWCVLLTDSWYLQG